MAQVIQTRNKDDVITGFDVEEDLDLLYYTMNHLLSPDNRAFVESDKAVEQLVVDAVDDLGLDLETTLTDAIENEGVEIFLQEASLSIWSGNMTDNAVVGISGDMPEYDQNDHTFYVNVRIGVNTDEISNPANWASHQNKFYGKSNKFVNPVIYTYNGFRMKPDVDYSIFLESGTAKIPNAGAWAGFVERAETRFKGII